MELALQYILYFFVIITSVLSLIYSTKFRRAQSKKLKGVYSARMNICMGAMLIGIALIQMVLFDNSTVRVIVGSLFLLIGLFNLFAGLRNHAVYARLKE